MLKNDQDQIDIDAILTSEFSFELKLRKKTCRKNCVYCNAVAFFCNFEISSAIFKGGIISKMNNK